MRPHSQLPRRTSISHSAPPSRGEPACGAGHLRGELITIGSDWLTDTAARITIPVEFVLQWDDEGNPDLVADAGPAAAPLLPALRERLTGPAGPRLPDRDEQIAAARIVWRVTGTAADVLPTVEAVLREGDVPVRSATKLLAEMARTAGAELLPALRNVLDDRYGGIDAARAMWRLGTDVDGPVEPLLVAAANPSGDKGATALLAEMRASRAVTGLTDLVDRDERVVIYGEYDESVWKDDRLRRAQREAIATITAANGE